MSKDLKSHLVWVTDEFNKEEQEPDGVENLTEEEIFEYLHGMIQMSVSERHPRKIQMAFMFFLTVAVDQIQDDKRFWRIVRTFWDFKDLLGTPDDNVWKDLFKLPKKFRDRFMHKGERKHFESLPERITVYLPEKGPEFDYRMMARSLDKAVCAKFGIGGQVREETIIKDRLIAVRDVKEMGWEAIVEPSILHLANDSKIILN